MVSAQPPGVPEILRKSVSSCNAAEQPEMFIIGKHFQKDSKVVFQIRDTDAAEGQAELYPILWSKTVTPDPEVLHSVRFNIIDSRSLSRKHNLQCLF